MSEQLATSDVPRKLELRDAPPAQCHYRAKVERVYDGDTVTLLLDLGLGHWFRTQARLLGLDAPEMRGADRLAAERSRDFLAGMIRDRWTIVRTDNDRQDKYGRLLVRLYLLVAGRMVDVNAELLKQGLAKPFMVDRDGTHASA